MAADIYVTLGRLLALAEAVRPLGEAERLNATSKPRYLLGHTLTSAAVRLRRRPELEAMVMELMDTISPDDYGKLPEVVPITSDEAGRMTLAYYHQRAHLPKAGQSKAPAGVDWSTADWSLSDQALADQYGVSRQAAQAARKRHAPSHQ